MTMHNSFSN